MDDFDYDLFVIGAGSGGVRAARRAAGFDKKVGIAESRFLGGTCVNVGCVPKKLFFYAAEFGKSLQEMTHLGWESDAKFSWDKLRDNKNTEIDYLNKIYQHLLDSAGVAVFHAHASLIDENTILLKSEDGDEQTIRAKKILIATGGAPTRPNIIGAEYGVLSDDLFYLPELPKKMMIVGGGYIGVEFCGIFANFGVEVTQSLRTEKSFLREFDGEITHHLKNIMGKNPNITLLHANPERIVKNPDGSFNVSLNNGNEWHGDLLVWASGRGANISGLNLHHADIACDDKGFIIVDDDFRTNRDSIFAIGDVIGTPALTPIAIRQAMVFAANQFDGKNLALNYDYIPTAIFSLPPIGTVGLSEEDALQKYQKIRIYRSQFRALKYSLNPYKGEGREKILVKLIVNDADDKIVGCHLICSEAAEIVQLVATLMMQNITKTALDETIALHPSTAEELVTMLGAPEIKEI